MDCNEDSDLVRTRRSSANDPVAVGTADSYSVIDLDESPHLVETMGGMRKAWVIHDGDEWLLKFPRPGAGGHWAEKIAAEVGELIGVNTAAAELPRVGSALATICRSFRPDEAISTDLDQPLPVLFHGSEFLAMAIPDYDLDRIRNNTAHNTKNIVRAVLKIMNDVSLDPVQDSERMMEVLPSYALLDGLIGNSDRHHDNWMVRLDY